MALQKRCKYPYLLCLPAAPVSYTHLEMEHNIIPYIGGEEEKSEKEPLRLWGKIEDGVIVPAQEPVITCQCIRVPVSYTHLPYEAIMYYM